MTTYDPTIDMQLNPVTENVTAGSALDIQAVVAAASPTTVRQCLGVKAAGALVSLASSLSATDQDRHAQTLEVAATALKRAKLMEAVAYKVIGDQCGVDLDLDAVGQFVTSSMIQAAIQEARWAQVKGGDFSPIPSQTLGMLFALSVESQSEVYDGNLVGHSLAVTRKICLIQAASACYGLFNHFDYFQSRKEPMLIEFTRSIAYEAIGLARKLSSESDVQENYLTQAAFAAAITVFSSSFRASAKKDVAALSGLSDVDRSIKLSLFANQGGMPYERVLLDFRQSMASMDAVAQLVFDSCLADDERKGEA